MNGTERVLHLLNQVANLNRDYGRTKTAETCYNAVDLINKLIRQRDEADEIIAKLKAENEILTKNADNAFQDGLNENRALFVKEIRKEIETAICSNTYPGFDSAHLPVMIWRARDGYDAVKKIIEKAAETSTVFSFRCPFGVGDTVWTVIEDEEDDDKVFASEEHVTDFSHKGVWVSGFVPPQDDCSVLIEWGEFGKNAFVKKEEALAEVERRKKKDA